MLADHTNYISDEIVREYRDVIQRKKFEVYKSDLMSILESVCLVSSWLREVPTNSEFELPDTGDQKYLDLALNANVDYIITGNVKDFPLKNYNNLKVLSPDEFLKLPNTN